MPLVCGRYILARYEHQSATQSRKAAICLTMSIRLW